VTRGVWSAALTRQARAGADAGHALRDERAEDAGHALRDGRRSRLLRGAAVTRTHPAQLLPLARPAQPLPLAPGAARTQLSSRLAQLRSAPLVQLRSARAAQLRSCSSARAEKQLAPLEVPHYYTVQHGAALERALAR
jgi:hypothetical protein